MNDLSFYNDVCFEIDNIMRENDVVGEESLEGLNSNIIGRMFVSIVDVFGQLACTFGTNLFKCCKDLKRSELHEWTNSNMLRYRVVEGLSYEKAIGVDVDVPANMKGRYIEVTGRLINLYGNLNAINTGTLVNNTFTDVLRSVNTNSKNISAQITSAGSVVQRVFNVSKPAVTKVMDDFDSKFTAKAKFEKVFLSMKELGNCRTMLLEAEPYLQDVAKLQASVKAMENTCKELVNAISLNNTVVTSRDLTTLSDIAKSTALLMNAYGMTATRQMQIEHNLVLVYNALYENAK